MPSSRDPVWQYAILPTGNERKWECTFCRKKRSGGASRIKAHLAGVAGRGIDRCELVSDQVRLEVRESLERQRAERSSSPAPLLYTPPHHPLPQSPAVVGYQIQLPNWNFSGSSGLLAPDLLNAGVGEPWAAAFPYAPPHHPLPQSHAVDGYQVQLPNWNFSGSSGLLAPDPLNAGVGEPWAAAPPHAPPDHALPQSHAAGSRFQLPNSNFSSSSGLQAPDALQGPPNAGDGALWAQMGSY